MVVNETDAVALASWTFDDRVIAVLAASAFIYVRGWLRGRRLIHDERDVQRLLAYLAGLAAIFIATESPLDTFDHFFLSAHMAQHLLLMMVAPPLILLGHPLLPLLRGLPRRFVKEGLGPFLSWPALRHVLGWLASPPVAGILFAVSTIAWHLPRLYELALQSPSWHAAQHASFFWTGILFWWPVIRPVPGKSKWPDWVAIPYLLLADLLNTGLSAFFVFSGTLLYPSYGAFRISGMTASDDQALAGAIMWVPGSILYIVPALVVAVRLFSPSRRKPVLVLQRKRWESPARPVSWLPVARRSGQVVMLFVAIAVIGDGFFGPQVAPMNLAGVLPWVHWRALSMAALLLVGNLFCMCCPFVLVRDLGRRMLPARLRWPKQLRTKWLAALLLVAYLWAYEAFALWDSPWLTACVITGYFAGAFVIDMLFRGATFCKYVCPIGQFHFITSLVSPREIGIQNRAVCTSCRTYDCIRGNQNARGCELQLFQPKKAGNLDCTFCLDCVTACPQGNVALVSVQPASTLLTDPYRSSIGRLSKRVDIAALALIVVFGAFVNAAGMVSPVMEWEHGFHRTLGAHAMPVVIAAFVVVGAVLLPALAVSLCALVTRRRLTGRLTFALVPIGIAMWAAHLLYHLGSIGSMPLQILLLDAGLLLTLYLLWRIGGLLTAVPWALLSIGLYAAGVWILLQPMQMRGMMP
jgi:cytochrome c oxidase assembly factor CtaG